MSFQSKEQKLDQIFSNFLLLTLKNKEAYLSLTTSFSYTLFDLIISIVIESLALFLIIYLLAVEKDELVLTTVSVLNVVILGIMMVTAFITKNRYLCELTRLVGLHSYNTSAFIVSFLLKKSQSVDLSATIGVTLLPSLLLHIRNPNISTYLIATFTALFSCSYNLIQEAEVANFIITSVNLAFLIMIAYFTSYAHHSCFLKKYILKKKLHEAFDLAELGVFRFSKDLKNISNNSHTDRFNITGEITDESKKTLILTIIKETKQVGEDLLNSSHNISFNGLSSENIGNASNIANKLINFEGIHHISRMGIFTGNKFRFGNDNMLEVFSTVIDHEIVLILRSMPQIERTIPSLKMSSVSQKGNDFSLVTGIAHDIKNALICLEMSTSEVLDELKQQHVNEVVAKNLNLSFSLLSYSQILLNDLRDHELINQNLLKKNKESLIDLEELINFVVDIFEAKKLMKEKDVNYVKVFNVAPGEFLCDEVRLKQVLINLMSNSFKFTQKGTITLTVEEEGDNILFVVEDTGCGMTSIEIAQLQKAFVKKENEANKKGWGIGMMIVKKLLNILGSTNFDIKSALNKGTRIEFSVPLKRYSKKSNTVNLFRRDSMMISKNKNISKLKSMVDTPIVRNDKIEEGEASRAKNETEIKMPSNVYLLEQETKNFQSESIDKITLKDNSAFYFNRETMLINKDIAKSFSEPSLLLNERIDKLIKEFDTLVFGEETLKIIVVDDNLQAVKSAKRTLDNSFKEYNQEIDVLTCKDGIECLFILMKLNFKVQLVISDLNMDFLGGMRLKTLIEEISGNLKINITFYFFSGDSVPGCECLEKPFNKSNCDKVKKELNKLIC